MGTRITNKVLVDSNGNLVIKDNLIPARIVEEEFFTDESYFTFGVNPSLHYSWISGYNIVGGTHVAIPPTLGGEPVQSFSGFLNQPITKIDIPEGIVRVEYSALRGTLISELVLPSTIEILKATSVIGCVNLTDVSLNEGLLTIENDVFRDCTN